MYYWREERRENLRPGSRPFRVVLTLGARSVVGALAAVFIAVRIPEWALKAYIGVLVLAVGIGILLMVGRTFAFSWKKVVGLGLFTSVKLIS